MYPHFFICTLLGFMEMTLLELRVAIVKIYLMIMSMNTVVSGQTSHTSHQPRATVRPRHAGKARGIQILVTARSISPAREVTSSFKPVLVASTGTRKRTGKTKLRVQLKHHDAANRCDWADGTQCQL